MTYRTAIVRKRPSTPMQWLHDHHYIDELSRKLDFGCGRGFDANHFRMHKYDPYYFPKIPKGYFDIITCHYVLNILDLHEQIDVIKRVSDLLYGNGSAFFTVRRDLKKTIQRNGYQQSLVYLDLPSLEKNSNHEIYHLSKDKGVVQWIPQSTLILNTN